MPKRDHKSLRADAAEIAAKLGNLVKGRRALLGMTYEELAARIGCTKSHIWEVEQGRSSNPTLGTFLGLAEAFGVSPTALMAELCGEAGASLADPTLARLSLALSEARRLLPELERLRDGAGRGGREGETEKRRAYARGRARLKAEQKRQAALAYVQPRAH